MFRFSKHCSYEDIFMTGAEFVHFPIAINSVQGKVTHCSIVLDVFKYKATPCNANFAGCFPDEHTASLLWTRLTSSFPPCSVRRLPISVRPPRVRT